MTQLTRRAFVGTAPLAAAALVGCARAVYGPARFAEAFVIDPSWKTYQPILHAVITTFLPLDDAAFAKIPAESIERRLITLFPLEKEQKFLGLQRSIVLFDEIDLFTTFSGPLLAEEMKARDVARRKRDWRRIAQEIRERDGAAFRRFAAEGVAARFTDLAPHRRAQYLALWRDSASVVKRQFHSSLKALVMITTFSMDEVWPAIGYAGPLLPRRKDAT
jgi:hypothetical protein